MRDLKSKASQSGNRRLLLHGAVVSTFISVTVWNLLATRGATQEKSVKPGINKPFEAPNPQEFLERFEHEGREVFDWRSEIVAACQIQSGDRIADVGAGTGLFSRLFSPVVGPTGHVDALDIAQNFVDYINRTCAEQGLKNVT